MLIWELSGMPNSKDVIIIASVYSYLYVVL